MADETESGGEPPTEESKYDQAFFLSLAAKGKDAWNAWRRDPANGNVRVTFAGIDFSESPLDRTNFAGFEFGDSADFTGCRWRGTEFEKISEVFEEALDPDYHKAGRASFTGAIFGNNVNFIGAAFNNRASFTGAIFGWRANFTGAGFGSHATFTKTTFGPEANFTRVKFGHHAAFVQATFYPEAFFTGAVFGDHTNFDQSHFLGTVGFAGYSHEQWTRHFEASLRSKSERDLMAMQQRNKDSWAREGYGPDRFLTISFANARFDGAAIFSGRSFDRTAVFTGARFYFPPDFDTATNLARIDFTGAHVGFVLPGRPHWTLKSIMPVRLRAFRKIAEDAKNHDLERDLYIEERKAERGIYLFQPIKDLRNELAKLKRKLKEIDRQKRGKLSNWWYDAAALTTHMSWTALTAIVTIPRIIARLPWIIVMFFYWALSNYGRSFLRPFAWLIASGFFFYWRYTVLMPKACLLNADRYDHAVGMLALGNAVPFVGSLTIDADIKKFLFCPGGNCPGPIIPPEGYQLLVLGQNLLSIILVFFIGLALRNYFKIK